MEPKTESVANKYTFVWRGSVEKNKSKLEDKVKTVLDTAEEVLKEEHATEDVQEISKEDFSGRADRILSKMDEKEVSDKKSIKKGRRKGKDRVIAQTGTVRETSTARLIQMPLS